MKQAAVNTYKYLFGIWSLTKRVSCGARHIGGLNAWRVLAASKCGSAA